MLVLKRHYQFWFSMLGLHKIGAIAIPATAQLLEHDLKDDFVNKRKWFTEDEMNDYLAQQQGGVMTQ